MEPVLQILAPLASAPRRRLGHTMYALIAAAITEGRLAAGIAMPSLRDLSRTLGVARNTVTAVYDRLVTEGYITAQPGRGFFICPSRQGHRPADPAAGERLYDRHVAAAWRGVTAPAPSAFTHDLFPGVPDTSAFPREVWRRLCARALRGHRPGDKAYAELQGRPGLRDAIARHLSMTRAIACTADDVLVTSGTQQAVDLLCRTLVTPGRTTVALENPGYMFAQRAFEAVGARVVPVPVDAEGMQVDRLPEEADIVFVAPSHQFPMGYALSPARRRDLIAFAARTGAVIVEDDYQAEFPTEGKPADALRSLDTSGCVIYIGTFSKSMFPELRLGFLVPPPWLLTTLLAAKRVTSQETPKLEQDALASFIREGHLARHVRKLRAIYAARRRVMLRCLAAQGGDLITAVNPDGGAYVTVELDAAAPAAEVARLAAEAGVRLMPLDWLYIGEPLRNGLVIGLGRIETAAIAPAIAILGEALRRCARPLREAG